MARNLFDEITFVVRDADGRIIVPASRRVRVAEARKTRTDLEGKYQFPDFEILELVTEEHEYILSELETPQIRWSRDIKAKLQREVQEYIKVQEHIKVEVVPADEKVQLLEKLKRAVAAQDISTIKTTGEELEERYGDQESILKEVGLAYCSHEETRKKGIELLRLVAGERADVEAYSKLAEAYGIEQQWEESALNYYHAGEIAGQEVDKFRFQNKAAYMYWLNHQYERAVEVAKEVLQVAQSIADPRLVQVAKNTLAYYWAETGEDLETARKWCLEILDVPDDEHFVDRIEKNAFEGERNAQVIDTLGRVVESLGRDLDTFRLYRRANRIFPNQPINLQNLARAYRKLGEDVPTSV